MPEPRQIHGDTALRRGVDLLLAVPCLVVLAPLLLFLGLLVKLESPGPALFRQQRMGRHGHLFPILKFRSMVAGAERQGPAVSGRTDPRITRVGHFLRATKLDELPQLMNIVRGEMTWFGPRAEVERYRAQYTTEELRLLEVRPGLTGPGQVYFTTHQAAELDQAKDQEQHYIAHQLHPKLAMDLDYLRDRSLRVDLILLWKTLAALAGWRR